MLPRTLDESIWTAAADRILRRAPDTARYLEQAMDATRESLASKVSGEVSIIAGLNSRWVHRWLSARIDFGVPDVAWSLTLIASDTSAGRIARAEPAAGSGPFSEAVSVAALTSLAQEVFDALRGEGLQRHATPQCEIRTCIGPPPCEGGVVSAEKWVLALQSEILVMVRLSERREPARSQMRRPA
jgi:hypothetical protein